MAKMRIFTVHINPAKKNPYETPVFVEEGMNWYAFVFRPFWAFSHRLWLAGIILLALMLAGEALVALKMIPLLTFSILNLAIMAYTGMQANDWRRAKLKRQGYIISDIVTASDVVGATQRYFERYYPHGRLPQTPPKHSIPAPA